MKDIDVYVVRTGSGGSDGLVAAFISKDEAIEHIVGLARKNSGRCPEVKLDGTYRVSVPDRWTRDKTSHRVYALTEHMFEGEGGRILGFHTTCDKVRKAMKRQSRCFFEEGWYVIPRFEITAIDLYACVEP